MLLGKYGFETHARAFGGSEYEDLNLAITTSDDGILIGGHSYSFGSGEADYYVVKLDKYLEPEPTPEPEPKESSGIPGFSFGSILIGLAVITLLYKDNNS